MVSRSLSRLGSKATGAFKRVQGFSNFEVPLGFGAYGASVFKGLGRFGFVCACFKF